jgi:hypothetical protein
MRLLSLFYRGSPPQRLNAAVLSVIAGILLPIFTCGDSFNKSPLPPVILVNPRDSSRTVNVSTIHYDAGTSASVRVDSGFVSATSCTLYMYLEYANGTSLLMIGKRKSHSMLIPDEIDTINRPPYCNDTNKQFDHFTFVYHDLLPHQRYYVEFYAEWYTPIINWRFDSLTFTTTDTSNSTTSP